MTPDRPVNPDPQELLSRYFLGSLSPEELDALGAALRSDPELARRFAEAARDEVLLFQLHTPAARQAEEKGLPARPSLRRRNGRAARPPWIPWLVAAAALVGIALFLALLTTAPDQPVTRQAELRRQAEREAARAERARKQAERRLEELERERKKLEDSRPRPDEKPDPAREKALADLEDRRRRVEEEMKAAVEQERRAHDVARALEKPEAPRPQPDAPEPAKRTEAAVAALERVEGQASVLTGSGKEPARAGQTLAAGQGLETAGAKSAGVVIYPDKTRLELGADSEARDFRAEGGKRLYLARGMVTAEVATQPAGQPMVFATPHAEARVLGTTLKLAVDSQKTRLEVIGGKVRLKTPDGKAIDVASGHFAVAAAGVDLAARPVSGVALIRQMPANSWLLMPNTRLRQVVPDPAKYPNIQGNGGPRSIVGNWSGGAFDPRRNQLLVWGGGSNYKGNEIYAFSVGSMTWERLTDPVSNPADSGPANPDGTPRIRDTYNGLAFITHADRFFVLGGYLPNGRVDTVWTFDPTARKWASRGVSIHPTAYGSACAYDPATRRLWWGEGNNSDANAFGLYSYDYDADRWTKHTPDGGFHQHTAALDTRRGLLVFAGKGEVFAYAVRGGGLKRQVWKTTGADDLIAREAPGLDYDPVADRLVGWAGGTVYALNPDTRVWTPLGTPGAPAPTQTGIYGRWRYVPDAEAFIAVTDIDMDVHFYKLSSPKRK